MTQREPRGYYRQADESRPYEGRPRDRRRPPRQPEGGASSRYTHGPRYEEEWEWQEEASSPPRPSQRGGRGPRPPRRPYEDEPWQGTYEDEEDAYGPRPPYTRGPRPVYTNRRQVHTPPPAPEASGGKKLFAFVYNLLFYVVTIGILVMSVLFAFTSKEDASIFGYRFYTVLTDSMVPQADSPPGGFSSGDIIIVKLMDGSQVEEGDIVTFLVGDSDRFLTHRVVRKMDELNDEPGEYLVTKGDANNTNDPPIKAERVLGKKVGTIPKAGGVLDFIRENLWLCLICIVSTFGFIAVLKAYFFSEAPSKEQHSWQQPPAQRW